MLNGVNGVMRALEGEGVSLGGERGHCGVRGSHWRVMGGEGVIKE